ncbi:hypothetical protein H7U19_10700 [Hyunsoonleella sp. SJ7]|uniref:DUF4168 domain-containing protein n=1 Tax=Hyunsoonleella aquatilis TaxID=2762758 RepID=A0A923H924_9FLAO|nr:hypothetical protein [Hyunsoonleella aquatilis]MBC3758875.1 hypothetical protein [Hyunsoonleella aquatilis]
MKSFTLLIFVFLSTVLYAQPPSNGMQGSRGQGGGQRGGQGFQERQTPDFDAYKQAGIFYYDEAEVVKKIKIKKDKNLEIKVKKAIINYNSKIEEIRFANTYNFDTLNIYMNTAKNIAMALRIQNMMDGGQGGMSQRNEDNPMRTAMLESRKKIRPVRKQVIREEEALNDQLSGILSEKQYARWLKYQKHIKEALNPRIPSNNLSQGGPNRGGGGQFGNRQGNRMR